MGVFVPAEPAPGVYVTEQIPDALRVQVAELNVPEPAVRLQDTVPDGVVLVPESESVKVAEHVTPTFTGVDVGLQLTLVEVERLLTVNAKVPEPVK